MKTIKALLTIGMLGTLAGMASANTISFNTSVGSQLTPFSTPFTLNGFDTTLGTLTGINITLEVSGIPNLSLINVTGSSQAFTLGNSTTPIVVTGPDATSVTATETATNISGTIGPGAGPFNFAGAPFDGTSSVNVDPTNFSLYSGVGTFTENFNASSGSGSYSGSAANGVFFGGNASAAETITITYSYDAAIPSAPEPGTMALLGFGLVGLGLAGRRRFTR